MVALPHHTSQYCYALCSPAGAGMSADVLNPPLPAAVYHAHAYAASFQKGSEAAPSTMFLPSFCPSGALCSDSALAFSWSTTNATLGLGWKCPWRALSETPQVHQLTQHGD